MAVKPYVFLQEVADIIGPLAFAKTTGMLEDWLAEVVQEFAASRKVGPRGARDGRVIVTVQWYPDESPPRETAE
jgi:hypothetical protein